MLKRVYKFLFVAIGFSFFISATEMDIGDSQNTFFDEYDTYVKTEQVSFHLTTAEHRTYYSLLLNYFEVAQLCQQPHWDYTINKQTRSGNYIPCGRLYLRNSVFRI
jgi:uncharacterized protein YxeA